jgi:hypothetical protein
MVLLGTSGIVYEGLFERNGIKTGVPALIHLVGERAIDNMEIMENYEDNIKILKEDIRETHSVRKYIHKNAVPTIIFDDGDSYEGNMHEGRGKYRFNNSSVIVKTTLRNALMDGRKNVKKLLLGNEKVAGMEKMDFRSIIMEEMRNIQ